MHLSSYIPLSPSSKVVYKPAKGLTNFSTKAQSTPTSPTDSSSATSHSTSHSSYSSYPTTTMTDSLREKFKQLLCDAKTASQRYRDARPFTSPTSKHHGAAITAEVNVKEGIDFGDLSSFDNVMEGGDTSHQTNVAVSWLLEVASTVIKKVTMMGQQLRFTQKLVEAKADQEEVLALRTRVSELEKECEEIKQRSLKGTLILSSPSTSTSDSLLTPTNIKEGNIVRKESQIEACVRAMHLKSGVRMPLEDIAECHPLGRPGTAPNTLYRLVVSNRKPGSAWDTLAAGLLTGKNKDTKDYFKKEVNLTINFQLSKKKREVLKAVGEAKRSRKITKYGTDQNGRITIRVSPTSSWQEVTSTEELERLTAAPALASAIASGGVTVRSRRGQR